MQALKARLAQQRQQAADEGTAGKVLSQAQIEELRLKRLREEEQRELEAKEQKKRQKTGQEAQTSGRNGKAQNGAIGQAQLSPEEVTRRLRLLKQPVKLFAEDEAARAARLMRAQEDYQAADEATGGTQSALLELKKREKAKERERLKEKLIAPTVAKEAEADPTIEEGKEGETGAADGVVSDFERAAAELKERLEEAKMPVEQRILKYMRRWCEIWGADLEARPEAAKLTSAGAQATLQYQQTMAFMKPLWKQLRMRDLAPELAAGLWMIVEAIQQRNYLHGYDIYMRLAVGNAPWPIGVTSIGIHDRTAREKISHSMNAAHIMNDEATRKYLQGVKRLLTFMQRALPTDPSRCVDFDGFKESGRGSRGGGSDKVGEVQANMAIRDVVNDNLSRMALLEAATRGESQATLGLAPAPHFVEKDGSIMVPRKWEHLMTKSEVFQELGLGSPQRPPSRGPPTTSPH